MKRNVSVTQSDKKSRPTHRCRKLYCAGRSTGARQAWEKGLKQYCMEKYRTSESSHRLSELRVQWRAVQREAEAAGHTVPEISVSVLVRARARMVGGRAAGGGVRIVLSQQQTR